MLRSSIDRRRWRMERPRDVVGPDPVETDNDTRPEDGPQDVDQSPDTDYSQGAA